jgi:predicted DNA-binding ribbon-helix-helix protein
MVTSIRVDEELWRQARMYALENDLTMTELIESLLRERLKGTEKKDKGEKG